MNDRMTYEPGDVILSQCAYCSRLAGGRGAACLAFAAGIPQAILSNQADHRKPFDGDGGIRFELRPAVPTAIRDQLYRRLDAS